MDSDSRRSDLVVQSWANRWGEIDRILVGSSATRHGQQSMSDLNIG